MKTYVDNGYKYWYDISLRFWVIYSVDGEMNQTDNADYYPNKQRMLMVYPFLKFTTITE